MNEGDPNQDIIVEKTEPTNKVAEAEAEVEVDTNSNKSSDSFESHESFEFYDEDFDNMGDQRDKMTAEAQRLIRYGGEGKTIKVSNFLRITITVIFLLIIPVQILVETKANDFENDLIKSIQKFVIDSGLQGVVSFFLSIFTGDTFSLILGLAFFLGVDSLIAFKGIFVYCFGLYIIVFIKSFYNSPRPYWVDSGIVPIGHCLIDYGNPSKAIFNLVFFMSYNVFMYLQKYTAIPKNGLIYGLYALIFILTIIQIFVNAASGANYFNQSLITVFYSLIYLVVTILLDDSILKMSENIGFITRQSRKYKFNLLFFCIGMFVFSLIAINSNQEEWLDNQPYLINFSKKKEQYCSKYQTNPTTWLGDSQSFLQSSILFYIIGFAFGCSSSLGQVNCIDWVRTSPGKRAARTVLGIIIRIGFEVLKSVFQSKGNFTQQYFINFAFPNLVIPFVMYGPFQILCKKIGLVDEQSVDQLEDEVQQANDKRENDQD